MATGLLVLCIGRATKQVDTFMGLHKEYTGTMRLGQGTPSQDADTEVNEEAPWEHITGVVYNWVVYYCVVYCCVVFCCVVYYCVVYCCVVYCCVVYYCVCMHSPFCVHVCTR